MAKTVSTDPVMQPPSNRGLESCDNLTFSRNKGNLKRNSNAKLGSPKNNQKQTKPRFKVSDFVYLTPNGF